MDLTILVAAIDFGTTYSGWAYSFRHQYNNDRTKISAKVWLGGKLMSEKAPTTVLIEPDGKTFKAFGYDAEDMYADLSNKGKHRDWFYFRRFKMLLMDKISLERGLEMEDETGKKLSAKAVFSMAIRYLKDDLLEDSTKRIADMVKPEDIMWIMTVPAIWNDSAKQFMREAAVGAGINTNKLKLALEPETASLFCRLLPINRMTGDTDISKIKEGSKYMVLDAGGGTVDVTVHQVLKGGRLKEVIKASGGAWGGGKVDEAYRQFLITIVGKHVFYKFVNNHMDDYLEIVRDFELKKRKIEPAKDSSVLGTDQTKEQTESTEIFVIRFPLALKEVFVKETGENLETTITQTVHSGQIELVGDKLKVDARIMRRLFEEATKNIVDHIKMLFVNPVVRDVHTILMVGGFSESKMLQHAIRKEFRTISIIVPHDAGMVVLKGAVVFGHDPGAISERIAKYTYGIAKCKKFIEGEHDKRYKIINRDGSVKCDNIFGKHVEIGQSLKCDESFQHKYHAPGSKATRFVARLFATVNKNPKYVTDVGCFRVGEMRVDVDTSVPYKDRSFIISLVFGDTEILVKAVEKSGRETTCTLNCLE
ncbi:hypothetical protein CHS0354_009514 [Potamilus streckersoni]|uniref:Uncharacterized protein n=1 Tax=Potamilus streckersoni TaxID=2493646 RepID=A0AAE0RVQ7_9BIVA|nr:hypothetical protein CHS0354_009514 [Potamilus streckersoni]